ncbi:WG repeat-containing protein [Terrimonas sp.]|uniref:WG repeat-containing protein n=1 Tax=Terrimonas sp. TaxID=1914338 RepID=UPI000E32B342|nr:WG repeat-containing protein [Terrimonas sp.]
MNYCRLIGLGFAFLFTSCGTYRFSKTRKFSKLNNGKEVLTNQYAGYSGTNKNTYYAVNILNLFNLKGECNSFNLSFEDVDKAKISYWQYNDTLTQWKEQTFKGKWKKKYFEIYFNKHQLFVPLFFSNIDIDRIRIGVNKEQELIITHFEERGGNILFLAGGYAEENPYIFKSTAQLNAPLPMQENGKWGFQDARNSIVIPAQFDYVYPFQNGAAIVSHNKKYGLINREGKFLADLIYDKMEYFDRHGLQPVYNIKSGSKYGMMDTLGNLKIKPVYDSLANRWNEKFLIINEGKYGYACRDGIIIPAIYDAPFWFNYSSDQLIFGKKLMMGQAKKNGITYFVDEDGYEYDAKPLKGVVFSTTQYVPVKNTKRKLVAE